MNKVIVAVVSSLILLVGCTQTLHYPTVGAKNFKIRPASWSGEMMRKCCLPVIQIATGKEIYVCKHRASPECRKLTYESR